MGGAFLARADDATASSWNPAGLSYLLRPELSLVGFHSVNRNDGRDLAGVTTSTDRFEGLTPDFVSVAYPLQVGSRSGSIQVSYQRMLPVGGDRHIEDLGDQRAATVFDLDLGGGFDVLALGTGFQISRQFRLGVTLNRWLNGFEQRTTRYQRFVARTRYQTLQHTDFSLTGWNVNIGGIWSPAEQLNIGVVGKTPFTARTRLARGRTDFFDNAAGVEVVTTNQFAADNIRVEFPWAAGFGMSLRPKSALTISADYTLTAWSEARIRNYFLLERTPLGQAPPTPAESGDLFRDPLPYPTLNVDAPQADTEQIRAGVEWVLIRDRFKLPLRIGYFVDRQYFLARNGPPPRFHGFTVGTGVLAGPILLDVAYVLERGDYPDRESEDRVVHRSNRLWVSLIYRHGSGN
jgi:hypothetical protein